MNSFIPHISASSCAAVTQASGSTFARAFGVLKPEPQKALRVIYAVFRILDDCVDELSEATDKREALDYWQNQISKAYAGKAEHPIMVELAAVLTDYKIPYSHFAGLIDGCRMDIDKNIYATEAELQEYCYRVASLVGLCCMTVFGYQSPTSEAMAIALGQAFQLTNILRDVGEDLSLDRLYLPRETLARHGCSEASVRAKQLSSELVAALNDLKAKAEGFYALGFAEFKKDVHGQLKAARLMALTYRRLLRKIAEAGWPVFSARTRLSWWDKFVILCQYFFCKGA